MRLLIVEDERSIVDALTEDFEGILEVAEITICGSRDSALEAIERVVFDYAILDLKIPTRDEQLDADIDHGRAVYRELRSASPGTPVCFLTAFPTDDFITDLLGEAEHNDVWGSGTQVPMARMLRKGRLDEVAELIRSVKQEITLTDDIEINGNPPPVFPESRVLRIFGRRNQGASLLVERLSGGLSGVQVLRVTVRDQYGNVRISAAARIGSRTDIKSEIQSYSREVVRLPNGRFSVHIGDVFAGAGASAGVFYRLIPVYESLAGILRRDANAAALIVRGLEAAEQSWTEGRQHSVHAIEEIRRIMISDGEMNEIKDHLRGIEWEAFEQRRIQVRICSQHGDLHCENVLVDPGHQPVVIDYKEVGEAPASLDPITLELSLLFHPGSRLESKAWPQVSHAERWDDIESFANGCPAAPFVRAAREWATRVAAGQRELYATAYGLAVRQLKYPDTNRELVSAIIRAVIAAFQRT